MFLIYGAGGHGRVILDISRTLGLEPDFFIDDNPSISILDGLEVLSSCDSRWSKLIRFKFIVAIGANALRASVNERLVLRGGTPIRLIHPSAVISSRSTMGLGSVVMPGVVVNAGCEIGDNVILNTGCSIDHDCRIGDYVHICPGARLAGSVDVGSLSMIGIGASIIPGIQIGRDTVIGAGSVVVRSVPDNCKVFGNPAKLRD